MYFAFQVQTQGGKSMSRREFGMQLVESLVKKWAFSRLTLKTMPREVRFLIGSVFGVDPEIPGVDTEETKKRNRCNLCPRASNRKSKITCVQCKKHICPLHTVYHCKSCSL